VPKRVVIGISPVKPQRAKKREVRIAADEGRREPDPDDRLKQMLIEAIRVRSMKLADFIVPEAIIADLRASTKEGAVREMVDALHAAGCVGEANREAVVKGILGREQLGSTGIGDGVAMPETRLPAVARLVGSIALSRSGIEFDAPDGEPVHMFFLVVSPLSQPGALERFERAELLIGRLLRREGFLDRLRRAGTREEIVGLLAEADRDSLWEAGQLRRHQGQPPA
jgi:mannitol/fructose-specific phosphotransferase system IIA component (Ntr-type)